jgi:hypothetical protein
MSEPDVLRQRLQAADPVPHGAAAPPSAADARLLGEILAAPRRRRGRGAGRLVAAIAVVAAVGGFVLLATSLHHGAPSDEVEALPPGAAGPYAVPPGGVVHIVTAPYEGHVPRHVGPGRRDEGWAQPSTGRARFIEFSAHGRVISEVVVDQDHRVRRWFGPGRTPQDTVHRASEAAADRRLVLDRPNEMIRERIGVPPAWSHRRERTIHTRYAGRPALEKLVTVTARQVVGDPGAPSPRTRRVTLFARAFWDVVTHRPLGFEWGDGDPLSGHARVNAGERVLVDEVLTGAAAERRLAWHPAPKPPGQ